MKNLIFWVSTSLIFAFWPISFFLTNAKTWPIFFLAPAILCFDWVLYLKKFKYHYFLYLILPLIHPTYLVFPVIAILLNIKNIKNVKKVSFITYTALFIFISFFSYKTFYVYSIFTPDPLAKDTLIKKISLIPNRNLARIYENKTTIFLEKCKANVFLSLDLNNYFFSLHPREEGNSQNLSKYPYLAIIPFLLGIFFLLENAHKKWLITMFIAAVFSLGFINNQDRYDLLIFPPVSLLCFYGLRKITTAPKIWYWIFTVVFIPVSLFELTRIIIFKQ